MIECSVDAYKMQVEERTHEDNKGRGVYEGQGGYQGRGRWGGFGWEWGHILCYNYVQVGHYERDFQNATKTCKFSKYFDHVIEHCLVLIAKMEEKRN